MLKEEMRKKQIDPTIRGIKCRTYSKRATRESTEIPVEVCPYTARESKQRRMFTKQSCTVHRQLKRKHGTSNKGCCRKEKCKNNKYLHMKTVRIVDRCYSFIIYNHPSVSNVYRIENIHIPKSIIIEPSRISYTKFIGWADTSCEATHNNSMATKIILERGLNVKNPTDPFSRKKKNPYGIGYTDGNFIADQKQFEHG
jgi:hypothetical protein